MNLIEINNLYQLLLNLIIFINKFISFIILNYQIYSTNFRSLKINNKLIIYNTDKQKKKLDFFYNYILIISFLEPILSLFIYIPFKIFLFLNKIDNFKFKIERSKNYINSFISKIKLLDISNYFEINGLYVNNINNYNFIEKKLRFESNTLLGFYPHNFVAYGFLFNGILSPYFDNNIKWLVSSFLSNPYLYPFNNNLKKKLNIESISNIKNLMSNGNNIALIPGGFYDASLTINNQINCFISIGSIKNCIRYNYNYIPCFTCGEECFYKEFIKINKYLTPEQLELFYKLNIPTIFLKQKINISGTNKKLITIIGDPINCKNKTILELQDSISKQLIHLHNLSKKYFKINSNLNIIFENIIN